ncbi:MAG: EamA family transporter [Sarcina sp.]
MNSKNLTKGILLIILAALCTSFGQLFWKLGVGHNILLILLGFVLYAVGALSMIIAFKFGNLSILHPLMCVGYIFALIIGALFLNEKITMNHAIGIIIIIVGVIFIARGEK